ncbi:hypothetical protein SAMN05444156_0490 [Verrucomicrobium sp. GAS474]|nr:hypothetical protein SAMN05444156_0490 [Verrucomicrobium sp. GAS474]
MATVQRVSPVMGAADLGETLAGCLGFVGQKTG